VLLSCAETEVLKVPIAKAKVIAGISLRLNDIYFLPLNFFRLAFAVRYI
jgi:hypothetical protein